MDEDDGGGGVNPSELLAHLAEQVHDVHGHVCRKLLRKYSSVMRKDDHTARLGDETLAQFSRIKPLFQQLQQLTSQHGTHLLYADRLADFDRLLAAADHFLQIHTLLLGTSENLRQHMYINAVDNIESIQRLCCELDLQEDMERCVQKALQMELCVSRESLMFALSEAWNHWLAWTVPVVDTRPRINQTPKSSVTSLDIRNTEDISNIVRAMERVGMLESRLKTFADRLITLVIEPVVRDDGNMILDVTSEPERCFIRVVVPLPMGAAAALPDVESTTLVDNAFGRLEKIFTALHDILANIPNDDVDATSNDKTPLVQRLGRHTTVRVFECLYRDCLSVALPKNRSSLQWETYRNVIAHAERFQETLMRLGLFSDGQPSLMDYLNNVNSLFANVKSQEILMRAHQLMTLELTGCVEVSADEPLGSVGRERGGSDAAWDTFIMKCRETAGTANFKHPSCRVSASMCSLVELAYETVMEALSGSREVAYQLTTAIRNIFTLYCDVVPSYHSDKIAAVPLVAALHHNNCMFIAHHLITLDKCLRIKLTPPSSRASASPLSGVMDEDEQQIVDLVPVIKSLGNDSFTEHIREKTSQLCQTLHDAGGFMCVADDEGREAMSVVDALMFYLKNISATWVDILPINVYCRSIGSLLNVALDDIIEAVTHIEEFSAEDCKYLQSVLDHLSSSSIELFRIESAGTSAEVTTHESVADWMKLKELSMLLGSNLQQVRDRWADGKGPLALYFTGAEVVKLVVAMFEKTTKRDAIIVELQRRHSVHLT